MSTTDSGIVSQSEIAKMVTVPCASETTVNLKLLKRHVRPLSLDLSDQSEQTYSKTSTESITNTDSKTNSLPLLPKPRKSRKCSLQSDEPPPRHLLGPKPAKFKTLSLESKLSSESEGSKLSMEITPILEVSKNVDERTTEITPFLEVNKNVDEGTTGELSKDNVDNVAISKEVVADTTRYAVFTNEDDDNFSDMFVKHMLTVPIKEISAHLEEGQIKFIDDLSPESTDVETLPDVIRNIDSDIVSQQSVPLERSDTDSQVDIISESSADTIATAVEVKDRSTTIDSPDILNLSNDNLLIRNPHFESLNTLNTYELLTTDGKLSIIDESNPKLAKDFTNKMSKESTRRLSKNLATEITDFFKSSASKLKPPCLDQAKKELANKKTKIEHEVIDSSYKTPAPLIPRSPYITPIPVFEQKVYTRKPSVRQPPFYVWNINSKNAAVCTTLNPSANQRISANDDYKALKDIENSTRKILELAKRTNGDNTALVSPNRPDKVGKSASTGELAPKSQREPKMSHSQSNDLKPKLRLFSSKNKAQTKPRASPNRLLVPKASPKDHSPAKASNIKDFKLSIRNLPKITIPLPSPLITVAKVKTQLPCDFNTNRTCDNTNEPCASTSKRNDLPNAFVEHRRRKISWRNRCRSLMHLVFGTDQTEFGMIDVPPRVHKRSNTWPSVTYPRGEEPSKYMRFK